MSGDGEVEAGLVDGGCGAVQRHHRRRKHQSGVEEFKNIWRKRRAKVSLIINNFNRRD